MTFIFRGGTPVAVPVDYATEPVHAALVERLTTMTLYLHAVVFLESHGTDGYLAADILTGAPWARRYLNTTARLWAGSAKDRALATRGWRALMHMLNGTRPTVGRHREPPLSAEALLQATQAVTHWRLVVEPLWAQDRATLAATLLKAAAKRFPVSAAHRRATRALVRRPGLRKRDLVLTFASWETDLPQRRLQTATPAADLVYM